MTSIKAAILATIQRVREFYQLIDSSGHKSIAIPPEWINSAPLVLHMEDKSQWAEEEKLQHEYELSRFANAVQNHPFIWDSDGNVLWEILRQVLDADNTEITEDVLDNWSDARFLLEEQYVKTQSQDIDFQVTSINSDPQWQKIEITADQFSGLIERAEADEEFINIYEIIQGGDLQDVVNVQKISFEMAFIQVDRPWLKKELLESRHWRLRNNATVDGKSFLSSNEKDEAFKGALPGYPTAFVLTRNFEVALNVDSSGNEEEVNQYLEEEKTLNFGPVLLNGNIITKRSGGQQQMLLSGLSASLKAINFVKFNFQLNQQLIKPVQGGGGKGGASGSNALPTATTSMPAQMPAGSFSKANFLVKAPRLTVAQITVTDKNQKPIDQAEVAFKQVGNTGNLTSQVTKTGANGKISLKLAADSQYKLLITKPGYKRYKAAITTKAGKVNTINAMLHPKTIVENTEKVTDIQLLAVVYEKLRQSPNPIEDFESFEDSMF